MKNKEEMLGIEDILKATEIRLYLGNIIYIVDEHDDAYGFHKVTKKWEYKRNYYDYFESSLMLEYFEILTPDEAVALYKEWLNESDSTGGLHLGNNKGKEQERIETAIKYTVDCHSGQIWKESKKPFIVKPLEVFQVLSYISTDVDLMIAGILLEAYDDSLESKKKLQNDFGDTVANLVLGYQNLRDVDWNEDIYNECQRLEKATKEEKILTLADIVVKQRHLLLGYSRTIGNYWKDLGISYENSAKYFSKIQDALYDLEFDDNLKSLYWEMVNGYKELFVRFYYDENRICLYQVSADGNNVYKTPTEFSWLKYSGKVSEDAICIPRDLAERIEDHWDGQREPIDCDSMN